MMISVQKPLGKHPKFQSLLGNVQQDFSSSNVAQHQSSAEEQKFEEPLLDCSLPISGEESKLENAIHDSSQRSNQENQVLLGVMEEQQPVRKIQSQPQSLDQRNVIVLQVDPQVWRDAYKSLYYEEDSDGTDPFAFTEKSSSESSESDDELLQFLAQRKAEAEEEGSADNDEIVLQRYHTI